MKKIFILLLLISAAVSLYAVEQQPRVAVVPFNAIGVSEKDAQVLSGLFETALVKTNSFSVIEQNQVKEIVEAQAYSMSGCADEACAIEFGELLSAEQIILGDVSMIGGKYIINVKIIDVAQGKNIKADSVEAASMADMTTATELLAYKLAGLTFSSGGSVQIVEGFGEVLIETIPSGADIFINGENKGVSPDLITRIPIGIIRIEAKKGRLYGVTDVPVSAETGRILLALEEMYGNVFIKSSNRDVDVYLDGESIGNLGTGFFEHIAVGPHLVELRGKDTLWKEEIEVENGVSTKVDAYPRPFGSISYNLPEGVTAELKSREESYRLMGRGTERLWVGNYLAFVSGGRFEASKDEINIEQGGSSVFEPDLVTVKSLEEEYFQARYDKAERKFETVGGSSLDAQLFVDKVGLIRMDLNKSQHSFPQLINDIEKLYGDAKMKLRFNQNNEKLAVLKTEREEFQAVCDAVAGERGFFDTLGWSSLAIGGGGLITAGLTKLMAESAYDKYLTTVNPETALEKRQSIQTLDFITITSLGVGVLFAALSPVCFNAGPDVSFQRKKIKELDQQIAVLSLRTAK